MKEIGFIGIGIMGKSMARNLMKQGYSVTVYARTQEKAQELLDEGAKWAASVADCAAEKDAVITMVGYPKDVQEVYFGEGGVIAHAKAGAYLIDMTSTSPRLSVEIYEAAKARGSFALDAPVSGGDVGARGGTLAIMVGGDKAAFDVCLPVLEAMGKSIRYEGAAGFGQHTKVCNQVAIAGAMAGVCEAMVYAKANGLDMDLMLETIGEGTAGSRQLTNIAPRVMRNDYAPGFFVKHYIKDLNIAQETDVPMPIMEKVLEMYKELAADGHADDGTQVIYKYYDKN